MRLKSIIFLGLILLSALLFFIFADKSNSSSTIPVSELDPAVGLDNAPITVVMFGRYRCSFSKQFFNEIYPILKEKYIDTGKVKFVYKHFYYPKDPKKVGAEASLCAHDQGMFWPYNALLYDKVKEWGQLIDKSDVNKIFNPILNQYAIELGLDEKAFLECLTSHLHSGKVEQDYSYARDSGVSGTPTFFINDLKIDGLPSLKDFESILLKFKGS